MNSIAAGFIGLAVVLAALQLVTLRHTIPPPDAITYFEVADQISRVGYAAALPLHWSPLYPLYALAARRLGSASLNHELAVTAAADAVALVALCVIVVLVFRSLARLCWPDDQAPGRAWLSYAGGAGVFLAFGILRVGLRMPDVLVTCLAIITLWLWCQASARQLDARWSAVAGIVGGAAFLARANLLHWSVAVGVLACVLAPGVGMRRRARAFASFCVGLLIVVGPQTYLLSSARGSFVWGESGRMAFAVAHGAAWPAGAPAWPVRRAGGDVRLFTETHAVNFPGFYDPGREFDDATVTLGWGSTIRAMARASTWCLMGNVSPSFALMWPLLWAAWPALLFGLGDWRRRSRREDGGDGRGALRRRLAWLLILAGCAGVGMHLLTFCYGYYMPPYFIASFTGLSLMTIDARTDPGVAHRYRAAHVVGIGFAVAATLLTLRYYRSSEARVREVNLAEAQAMAAALKALPSDESGLRKIAVAGYWLGLYGIRLSDSQVAADLPDVTVLRDRARLAKALAVLRTEGIVALLVPTAALKDAGIHARPVGGGQWSVVDLRSVPPGPAI